MPKCHSTAEQVHGNMVFKMGAPSWIMQCRLKTFPRMVTLVWSPELENTLRCCCRTALISQHAETIACLLLQDKARLHCWGREVWFHLFTCESFFHIFPLPPVTLTISLPFLLFYLSLFFFFKCPPGVISSDHPEDKTLGNQKCAWVYVCAYLRKHL